MHLLASANALPPGLPARTGDAPTDGEKPDDTAIFEAFLGLALAVPSPDGAIVTGPEGKGGAAVGLADLSASSGNPATRGGKMLPLGLPGLDDSLAETAPAASGKQPRAGESRPPAGQQAQHLFTTPPAMIGLVIKAAIPDHASPPQSSLHALAVSQGLRGEGLVRAPLPFQQAPASAEAVPSSASPASLPAPALATIQLLTGPAREAPAPGTGASGTASETADAAAQALTPRPTAPASKPEVGAEPATQDQPASRPARDAAAQPQGHGGEPDAPKTLARFAAKSALPEAAVAGSAAPAQTGTPLPAAPVPQSSPIKVAVQPRRSESITGGQDFADIVDRLARAREANTGEIVRTTVTTRDFGPVAMQMRTAEGRLHVAMTATDPGFAPAVQAASAAGGAGQQQTNTDGSATQQQGQSSNGSAQGQAAADSQARQHQQAERAAQGQRLHASDPAAADETVGNGASRGEASGAIYA